jgi:hypothetical protein
MLRARNVVPRCSNDSIHCSNKAHSEKTRRKTEKAVNPSTQLSCTHFIMMREQQHQATGLIDNPTGI